MINPAQAFKLSGVRRAVALSRRFTKKTKDDLALRYAQVGMPFVSEYSSYLTVHLKSKGILGFHRFKKLVHDLHSAAESDDFSWVAIASVSFEQWTEWSKEEGFPIDKELFNGQEELKSILSENQPPYAYDGGELFFQIQSFEPDETIEIVNRILLDLDDVIDKVKTNDTLGDSLHGGRIYGGRMLHGLISSVDPICFSTRAIIGDELPDHKGGCFCLTQRFIHDWQQLLGMADNEMENLIGRDHKGNILLQDDERAHVKLVRVNDEDGLNYRLVGQSQPFRSANSLPGKEDGVYQISYAKNLEAFNKVLQSMLGDKKGYIKCRHLNVSHADLGNFWYVPSAPELGLHAPHDTLTVLMNEFFDVLSENGKMFYNTKNYLFRVGNRDINFTPAVSDRVIELLGYTFSRWHNTWYNKRSAPELKHLSDYITEDEKFILDRSIAERKGYAVKKALELLSSEIHGKEFDTFRIHPKELLVGVVPDYTLGSGFEVIKYLNKAETAGAFLLKLSEAGAAGHNVPLYQRILTKGVGKLINEMKEMLEISTKKAEKEFYQSAIYAFEGVQNYFRNYAKLALKKLEAQGHGAASDRNNLRAIAERMEKLSVNPPETFIDAAQMVLSMHCCMHIGGESVSIGRLDQLLQPFYETDKITATEAQEIIDCFWIKIDEKVLLNHRHVSDRLTRGSGAITYEGGDFPQGAALNQWVQQITVGGYKANDNEIPQDGCNDVTRMCLRAARRLPLNAPCLSLRVNDQTPIDILEEAADCILSGGGHPFLINDDRIISGLLRSGEGISGSKSLIKLADARDMVCDGCFESLIAGKNEFAFCYVPVPDAIEMALNQGRTFAAAGPVHITGLKASFRSKAAKDIENWDEFYQLFLEHYKFKLISFYDGMLSRYGNLNKVCPSPLLSPLVEGCLESGRDMTAGGAQYKLLAPLMNGIAPAIDSLWAIKDMVYNNNAVFTLPELYNCLICDWGYDMKEPFYSKSIGEDRIAVNAKRFKNLRLYALGLPKFGNGITEVDDFGKKLVADLVNLSHEVIRNPVIPIAEKMDALRSKFSSKENPFEFIITPGIATFEDNEGVGSFLAASADGRRNGQTVPSDFSPSSWPIDLPVPQAGRDALTSLKSWIAIKDSDSIEADPIGCGLSNGAPLDINIREDFPKTELVDILKKYAQGEIGSNMMSVSCANPETLLDAQNFPEKYDLIRLRMGGWSEFFVAMFPNHQEQHKRRPLFEAKKHK